MLKSLLGVFGPYTKCSCRVKKKISVKFYGGAVTISDNNFWGDFSGISLIEKVGPPFKSFKRVLMATKLDHYFFGIPLMRRQILAF